VKISEIAAATGCSEASASDYRRGKWTPHVSIWGVLSTLVVTTLTENLPDLLTEIFQS
jgi:hypothetical protein